MDSLQTFIVIIFCERYGMLVSRMAAIIAFHAAGCLNMCPPLIIRQKLLNGLVMRSHAAEHYIPSRLHCSHSCIWVVAPFKVIHGCGTNSLTRIPNTERNSSLLCGNHFFILSI